MNEVVQAIITYTQYGVCHSKLPLKKKKKKSVNM